MKKEGLVLDKVVLLGRTFEEYVRYFALDPAALRGQAVLDVASGVSSFCAEANAQGIHVTAFDLIYELPPEHIEARCGPDLDHVIQSVTGLKTYKWDFYQSPEGLRPYRERAYKTFLADYRAQGAASTDREPSRLAAARPDQAGRHVPSLDPQAAAADGDRPRSDASGFSTSQHARRSGRYVPGSLPRLPFRDGQFDLALASYLLFVYEDHFDYEFHKHSVLEIMRVTKGEARLYPLVSFEARRCSHLDLLKSDPDLRHLSFEEVQTDFEFLVGSNWFLRVRRR
jgi:hypothetical protein